MADSRVFKLTEGVEARGVAKAVEAFLRNKKNLFAETLEAPEGFLVQAKQEDKLKNLTGMGTATQIQIIPTGDMVTVNVGAGKWADKAGAAAAGWFLFAPLAVTAGIGAWAQKKLPEEIFQVVESYIMSGGKNVSVSFGAGDRLSANQVVCSNCKSLNDKNSSFCSVCGQALYEKCPNCNSLVEPGAKFCASCGHDLSAAHVHVVKSCSNCGHGMQEGEVFCSQCGTKNE